MTAPVLATDLTSELLRNYSTPYLPSSELGSLRRQTSMSSSAENIMIELSLTQVILPTHRHHHLRLKLHTPC
ncbi:hypothetical protein BV898_13492 [Hypsibius exemplaris]|uniref:Uncharacterized protein n=1 Tax=Hypsibius exemplaris TaxID=2072580 RepID=A0A1W0WAN0_HYPEX|nr:hypothetical protein BV898_13492 [Hypsibius exemplaris]